MWQGRASPQRTTVVSPSLPVMSQKKRRHLTTAIGTSQVWHLKTSSEVERQKWITTLELARAGKPNLDGGSGQVGCPRSQKSGKFKLSWTLGVFCWHPMTGQYGLWFGRWGRGEPGTRFEAAPGETGRSPDMSRFDQETPELATKSD